MENGGDVNQCEAAGGNVVLLLLVCFHDGPLPTAFQRQTQNLSF